MPEQHLQRVERLAAVTQQVGFALWPLLQQWQSADAS
jgi:hypothetical protein